MFIKALNFIEISNIENKFSWELAATVIGVFALIIEAIIRIYVHNSKNKSVSESKVVKNEDLTESEIKYLKDLSQNVANNSNKMTNQDLKIKNLERLTEELKNLIREVEKDNFSSLSNVSDKIDILKNILLEAKMNSKK